MTCRYGPAHDRPGDAADARVQGLTPVRREECDHHLIRGGQARAMATRYAAGRRRSTGIFFGPSLSAKVDLFSISKGNIAGIGFHVLDACVGPYDAAADDVAQVYC